MTSSPRREIDEGRLDEQYLSQSSLAHAKAEHLLDVRPALCLYFAALRSTSNPPSVPLPRRGASRREKPESSPRPDTTHLSLTNCPAVFIPFLRLWSSCVPTIQNLAPEYQHDLARIICGLPPLAQPLLPISQRRSFQDRYASDLQAAIDASFVPPPMYAPSPVPAYPGKGKIPPAYSPRIPTSNSGFLAPPSQMQPPQRTPTIATPTSPAIELIRETLYAALADVLTSTPSLIPLLKTDPPRAYFGAVALAILSVTSPSFNTSSPSSADNSGNNVLIGVRGVPLTLADCPATLRREAAHIEEEDTVEAIRLVQEGRDGEVAVPRLERARLFGSGGRRSTEGRAVAFANRVNALALAMTRLPQFKERQDAVFKVLAGVGLS
ncbi:hypothetical protein BJV77DRAFT_1041342 [Russula vinacea]|nr:hypothetical protein BJV77DRAFT_1041342 [Russula vinacea]